MSSCFLESLVIFEYAMLIALEKLVGTIWDLGWDTFLLSLAHQVIWAWAANLSEAAVLVSQERPFMPTLPALLPTVGTIWSAAPLGVCVGEYWQVQFCMSLYSEATAFGGPNVMCLLLDSQLGCLGVDFWSFYLVKSATNKVHLGQSYKQPQENRLCLACCSRNLLFQRFLSLLSCQLFYTFKVFFKNKLLFLVVFSGRGDLNNPEEESS